MHLSYPTTGSINKKKTLKRQNDFVVLKE